MTGSGPHHLQWGADDLEQARRAVPASMFQLEPAVAPLPRTSLAPARQAAAAAAFGQVEPMTAPGSATVAQVPAEAAVPVSATPATPAAAQTSAALRWTSTPQSALAPSDADEPQANESPATWPQTPDPRTPTPQSAGPTVDDAATRMAQWQVATANRSARAPQSGAALPLSRANPLRGAATPPVANPLR